MFPFIYYWLIERTKYFLVSFFPSFFVLKHRKKNVAKPRRNLRVGPKIIIIFSFQNFFLSDFWKNNKYIPSTALTYKLQTAHPQLFQLPLSSISPFPQPPLGSWSCFSHLIFLPSLASIPLFHFLKFILPLKDWFLFPWCLCLPFDPAWLHLLYLFFCKQRIFKTSISILSPLHVKNYMGNWIFHLSSKEEAS